MKINDEEGFE